MLINKDINFVRGNTYVLDISINNLSVNIDKMYFTLKENAKNKEFIIQKTLGHGIENIENNLYRLTIDADDTEELFYDNAYGYDIKIIMGDIKKTIITGTLTLSKNYTRKENEV